MSPFKRHRDSIFSGLRHTIERAQQIEAGADPGIQYSYAMLEGQKEELATLERGALRWYAGYIRAWFTPFPWRPRQFVRRVQNFIYAWTETEPQVSFPDPRKIEAREPVSMI